MPVRDICDCNFTQHVNFSADLLRFVLLLLLPTRMTLPVIYVTDVHRERVEHQLFGAVDLVHETTEEIEHRIIEEELEVQLNLMEQQHELAAKETQLFPDEMMASLPHLHEHADAEAAAAEQQQHVEPLGARILHEAENDLVKAETLMGEDTLETLAMCAVVMAIVLLPQLMS